MIRVITIGALLLFGAAAAGWKYFSEKQQQMQECNERCVICNSERGGKKILKCQHLACFNCWAMVTKEGQDKCPLCKRTE